MDRVFEVILAAVHRCEGTVNQFLGDGIMALFGAPIAHEDHAARGAQAAPGDPGGLKPLAAESRRTRVEFRMRIGINTGPVVVGAIGSDLRMDYTAVGDTTNLAARLPTLAPPGRDPHLGRPAPSGVGLLRDARVRHRGGEGTGANRCAPTRCWPIVRSGGESTCSPRLA